MGDTNTAEARHSLISALLQATGPLPRDELVEGSRARDNVLSALVVEGLAVEGRWDAGSPVVQYRWAARWHEELRRNTSQTRRELRERLAACAGESRADLFGDAARLFSDYTIHDYQPPADKRLLVVLQCSVGRPFSSSPSHASMRRAISLATGRDPHHEFEACPVHVVVLASEVGPTPYELEDVPPATIPALGVKQFGPERYARALPVLAERMAGYLGAHRACYDRAATFTDGRYAEVMREAQSRAGCELAILPVAGGALVRRCGRSTPRTYWEKYWIQLYLEVVSWLPPAAQAGAAGRLAQVGVDWD